jgi:S-methylmethionine-dependent homocysteine/selenocysteine methylase
MSANTTPMQAILKASEDMLRAAKAVQAATSQDQVDAAMRAARKAYEDMEVAAKADEAEGQERAECWRQAMANSEKAREIARAWMASSAAAKLAP